MVSISVHFYAASILHNLMNRFGVNLLAPLLEWIMDLVVLYMDFKFSVLSLSFHDGNHGPP